MSVANAFEILVFLFATNFLTVQALKKIINVLCLSKKYKYV